MGIDVNSSREQYPRRAIYYAGNQSTKIVLEQDLTEIGVFYCKDLGPFKTTTVSLGSIKRKETRGTIETKDYVPDLDEDGFVKYNDEIYRIEDVEQEDDNENKEFSYRPTIITRINLVK